MGKAKGGLGRGLGALLPEYEELMDGKIDADKVLELEIEKIIPNPDQPRKIFDDDKLMDLTESIREHGVLQPILVVPRGNQYMIIAGERRYRASMRAGKTSIPVLIREMDDEQVMELALIENVQRDDLSPIEEARAYNVLQNRFGYTQERLAKRMGKSRSSIANIMRLLALPEDVQQMVEDKKLTIGHVRPLLALDTPEWQSSFAHEIYQTGRNVREVEKMVQEALKHTQVKSTAERTGPQQTVSKKLSSTMYLLQEQLAEQLSTKVTIKKVGDGGKLIIEYYNDEDLQRIVDELKMNLD